MKRYYLSPIIGDGTRDNKYRTKVLDHVHGAGSSTTALIPQNMTNGKLLFDWCLVVVDTEDHTAILNDSTVDSLPDIALDTQIKDIPIADKNKMVDTLRVKYGLEIKEEIKDLEEVINKVGQIIDPKFNLKKFGVNK